MPMGARSAAKVNRAATESLRDGVRPMNLDRTHAAATPNGLATAAGRLRLHLPRFAPLSAGHAGRPFNAAIRS
jgi:hypothetical protein